MLSKRNTSNFKFYSGHIFKRKKRQVKSILIFYFIQSNISKILSLWHVSTVKVNEIVQSSGSGVSFTFTTQSNSSWPHWEHSAVTCDWYPTTGVEPSWRKANAPLSMISRFLKKSPVGLPKPGTWKRSRTHRKGSESERTPLYSKLPSRNASFLKPSVHPSQNTWKVLFFFLSYLNAISPQQNWKCFSQQTIPQGSK